MADQVRIVVAGIARDFCPEPGRLLKGRVFRRQLDLCHDEPFIRAGKDVDLSSIALTRYKIAPLLDERLLAELEHRLRVG